MTVKELIEKLECLTDCMDCEVLIDLHGDEHDLFEIEPEPEDDAVMLLII